MFDRQSLQRKPYTYSSRNSGRSPVAMFASGCNHRDSATERTSAWPADVHASMRQPDGGVRRIRHAWEGRTRSLPCRTQDQTPANEHIGPKPDDSAPHRTAPHRATPRHAAPRRATPRHAAPRRAAPRRRGMAWAPPARFGLACLAYQQGMGAGRGRAALIAPKTADRFGMSERELADVSCSECANHPQIDPQDRGPTPSGPPRGPTPPSNTISTHAGTHVGARAHWSARVRTQAHRPAQPKPAQRA
jgi:hypothetical protein